MPPASLILELFLKVMLPALAASAAVMFLLGRGRCQTLVAPLALAAGVAVSNWFREALPWLPEQAAWQWLPAAALLVLAVELLARIPHVPEALAWRLRAAAAALATWLLVPGDLRTEMPWVFPALLAAVLANSLVLERSEATAPSGNMALGLAGAFLGAAALLIHAHTARLADVAFLFGFSLAGIGLAAWWRGASTDAALPAAALALPGLLLNGRYETFSEVPLASFVLVALSPLALALGLLPPVARLGGFRLRLVQLGLVLLPVAIAVALAMMAEPLEFE